MHHHVLLNRALIAVTAVGITLTASTTALASSGPSSSMQSPWGHPHLLYQGSAVKVVSEATSTSGTTAVLFSSRAHGDETWFHIATRAAGQAWGAPVNVPRKKAASPSVIAWGDGQLSVIYSTGQGEDNYYFHEWRVLPNGSLAHAVKLIIVPKAVSGSIQEAIDSNGTVAFAWLGLDQHYHVGSSQLGSADTPLPPLPVHPVRPDGKRPIANPQALFFDDSGRISLLTSGTLHGSDQGLWLERLQGSVWRSQRVAPVDGGVLDPEYVDQIGYATNPHGDIAVSWQQQDPTTQAWSTLVRYAPAGKKLGDPTTLSDQGCPPGATTPCAGLAMAADGTTTIAYPTDAGNGDLQINVVRRAPDGTFTTPQPVSDPMSGDTFHGAQVTGNPAGDAIVSFAGVDQGQAYAEFARCPATTACTGTLLRRSDPGPLDTWVTSLGADGEATVAWASSDQTAVSVRSLAP